MSKIGQKSCNRRPFLSGDGCDRGNVDIHQFDDFPYCEKIDPTMPDIPPEIVDTPLQIPVPPSCACVNIKYALNFKYSKDRKFGAKADFTASGDCCEGNYVSNFDLQIPCPILGGGSKKIKMKIGYGTGRASAATSYIKTNTDSCTVEAKDVDINLNIPCPIKDAKGKRIKIGISYGDGKKVASASFIKTDTKKCEIEPLSPNINLNLPCPIVGRNGTPKIKASIKYGDGDSKASASYIKADPRVCTIEPLSPSLNLVIPCPIKDAKGKKIKIGISYGDGDKVASASFMQTDPEKCEVEALAPTLNLNLPCPVRQQKDTPKIKAKIGWGTQGASASASLLSVDVAACEIQAKDVNLSLNLPCPVRKNKNTPKIKAKISWGDGGQSASASFLTADPNSCQIRGTDAVLNLNLPCPIRGSADPPKLKAKIGWGDEGNDASANILTADPKTCEIKAADAMLSLNLPCPITENRTHNISITPRIGNEIGQTKAAGFIALNKTNCTLAANDVSLDLTVPCPISNSGDKKITISELQFGAPQSVTKKIAKLSNCDISMEDRTYFTLNVPCALKNIQILPGTFTTDGSDGWIEIDDDGPPSHSYCARNFKINANFPKPKEGTSLDREVVTDVKYSGRSLQIELTKFASNGSSHSRWKTVFTAVDHKSDHICCNDKQ